MTDNQLKYFMGIDPGQNGSICTVLENGMPGVILGMPKTEADIYTELKCISGRVRYCLIEKVHSMPGQGVASTFKFGVGYGGLRMALICLKIPFDEVLSRAWQRGLGITPRMKTESRALWKNRLKAKAQQLFPLRLEDITLATADGLLIAEYCRRTMSIIEKNCDRGNAD